MAITRLQSKCITSLAQSLLAGAQGVLVRSLKLNLNDLTHAVTEYGCAESALAGVGFPDRLILCPQRTFKFQSLFKAAFDAPC